jgi:hypothetical protein
LDKTELGTGLGTTQEFFEFASHLFDRIEVRGVSWQEEYLGAKLLN